MRHFSPGEVLQDRFEILGVLGTGGMGSVYRALDRQLERQVAVKTVPVQDERGQALLLREARLLGGLDVRGIPRWIETFVVDGAVSIVQDLVDGVALETWQAERGLADVLDLYRRLAEVLEQVHAQGIIHRDLKPSNVLVTGGEAGPQPYLMDLGLAVRTVEPDNLTSAGTVVGTPRFMAPEQMVADEVTSASDVYALGIMLYEAAIGESLWDPRASLIEQLASASEGPPEDLAERLHRAGLPEELQGILAAMLAGHPEDRPDAGLVAQTLASLLLSRADGVADEDLRHSARRPAQEPTRSPPPAPVPSTRAHDVPAGTRPTGSAPRPLLPGFKQAPSKSRFGGLDVALLLVAVSLAVCIAAWFFWPAPPGQLPPDPPDPTRAPPPPTVEAATPIAAHLSLLVAGLLLLLTILRISRPANAHGRPNIHGRLAGIESRLAEQEAMSQSMVLDLRKVASTVDQEKLEETLRRSMVLALKDVAPFPEDSKGNGDGFVEVVSVLRALAKSHDEGEKEPPSLGKQTATIAGYVTAVVIAVAGIVGLVSEIDLWQPNSAPSIETLGEDGQRARRGVGARIEAHATDPDGDSLSFAFEAEHGTIESYGNLAVWTPGQDPATAVVISVTVSDGRRQATASRTLLINQPPEARIEAPATVTAGQRVELRCEARDADGDTVELSWRVSCGTLESAAERSVFWDAGAETCEAVVICVANDGFETAEARAAVSVRSGA